VDFIELSEEQPKGVRLFMRQITTIFSAYHRTSFSSVLLLLVLMAFLVAGCAPITPAADPNGQAETATADAGDPIDAPLSTTETYQGMPVGFTPEGYPFRGDPNAPVTMYEYSDYECPFCARHFVQTEPALNDALVRTGQLRVVFRDFPIEQLHPNAFAAHIASLCVADQGAALYWEMHSRLFQTQKEWANLSDPLPVFERLAGESGAAIELYRQCMETEQDAKRAFINAAIVEGQRAGVSGTPSFSFVGADGEAYLLVGAQPYERFAAYVEALAAGEAPLGAERASGGEQEVQIPFWATREGWQPDPNRPGVNMAGDWYRGSLDAKVVVIEFSDFQCPFCRRHATETQPALDEEFVDTGQVLWIFKHFPLNIHPQAPAAGVAAECAGEQGKFWEMHDLLFANMSSWSVSDPSPVFADLAGRLDLDLDAFTACTNDASIADRVTGDFNDGAPFVQGTPTFIVLFNDEGRIIPGALPLETFSQALREIIGMAQ
jgi:protein-disulfide isomerase